MWSNCSLTRCRFTAAFAVALLGAAACKDAEFPTASSSPETPTSPLSVEATSVEFASVSAGDFHSCGVTASGAAYCWGSNFGGQLGNGTNTISNVPVKVSGQHTFASVSAGQSHSCGVTTAGAGYCWGLNFEGDLGNGTDANSNVPVPVAGGLTFASVTAGGIQSCGVTTAGAGYCWGANGSGQLGDGTNASSNVPVAVSGGHTFASVSAGLFHTCGVTTAGAAYCWGQNRRGQLGNGTKTKFPTNAPVAVSGGQIFASFSAGGYHNCGVTTAGAAYCWGYNFYGQVGSDSNGTDITAPVAVLGGLTFASVSAGWNHSCGVTTVGAGYCWGFNLHGELGNGTNADSWVPVAVSGGGTFASMSAGNIHSCGVTTAGAGACWGDNEKGQLGNGTRTGSNVPSGIRRN